MGVVESFVKRPLRFLFEGFKFLWEAFVYLHVAVVFLLLVSVLAVFHLGVYLDEKSKFFVDWLYDDEVEG